MNKKIQQQKQQTVEVQKNSDMQMETFAPKMEVSQYKGAAASSVPQKDDVFAEKKISKNSIVEEKIAVISKEGLVDYFSEDNKNAFQEVLRLNYKLDESDVVGAREEYKYAMTELMSYANMNLDNMSMDEQKKAYADVKKRLMSSLTKLKYKIRIEKLTAAEKNELQKQIDTLTQFRTEFEAAEEKFEDDEDDNGLINYLASKESFRNTLCSNIQKNHKSFYSDEYNSAMKAIGTYANMNLDKIGEKEQAKALQNAIKTVDKQLEVLRNRQEEEQDEAKKQLLKEEVEILYRYKLYFETTAHGNLNTENINEEKDQHLKLVDDKKIKLTGIVPLSWKDVSEMPLFSHEPTIDDIEQGCIGDCYLEAALVDIVANNPLKVKECIRDNGDGTATVRFFRRFEHYPRETIYVTVKKTIPTLMGREHYSFSSMWVQMIQKAYAASGLNKDISRIEDKKLEIEERYSYINNYQRSDPQRRIETQKRDSEINELLESNKRYVFEEKNSTYKGIVGGSSARVIEMLTGESSRMIYSLNASTAVITKVKDEFQNNMYIKEYDHEINEQERDKLVALMDCVEHIILKSVKKSGKEKYGPPLTIEDIYEACCSVHLRANELASYKEFIKKAHLSFYLDGDKEELGRRIKRAIDSIWPRVEKYLEEQGGYRLEHRMFETTKDKNGNVTGKYTPRALSYYEAIEKALKKGIPVGAGTQKYSPSSIFAGGLNGEAMSGGLAETHAYSILGVKEINGHKFILMRNPWKSTGVGYKKVTIPGDGTKGATVKYKSETVKHEQRGQFYLELNEFMTRTDCFYGILRGETV